MGYNTVGKRKFVKEMVNGAKNPTDAARKAGYKNPTLAAHKLMRDEEIAKKVDQLIDVGLDALTRIATEGKNEIAVAAAGKTLVETGMGKPKDNKQSNFGDVTINIAKIDPAALAQLKAS